MSTDKKDAVESLSVSDRTKSTNNQASLDKKENFDVLLSEKIMNHRKDNNSLHKISELITELQNIKLENNQQEVIKKLKLISDIIRRDMVPWKQGFIKDTYYSNLWTGFELLIKALNKFEESQLLKAVLPRIVNELVQNLPILINNIKECDDKLSSNHLNKFFEKNAKVRKQYQDYLSKLFENIKKGEKFKSDNKIEQTEANRSQKFKEMFENIKKDVPDSNVDGLINLEDEISTLQKELKKLLKECHDKKKLEENQQKLDELLQKYQKYEENQKKFIEIIKDKPMPQLLESLRSQYKTNNKTKMNAYLSTEFQSFLVFTRYVKDSLNIETIIKFLSLSTSKVVLKNKKFVEMSAIMRALQIMGESLHQVFKDLNEDKYYVSLVTIRQLLVHLRDRGTFQDKNKIKELLNCTAQFNPDKLFEALQMLKSEMELLQKLHQDIEADMINPSFWKKALEIDHQIHPDVKKLFDNFQLQIKKSDREELNVMLLLEKYLSSQGSKAEKDIPKEIRLQNMLKEILEVLDYLKILSNEDVGNEDNPPFILLAAVEYHVIDVGAICKNLLKERLFNDLSSENCREIVHSLDQIRDKLAHHSIVEAVDKNLFINILNNIEDLKKELVLIEIQIEIKKILKLDEETIKKIEDNVSRDKSMIEEFGKLKSFYNNLSNAPYARDNLEEEMENLLKNLNEFSDNFDKNCIIQIQNFSAAIEKARQETLNNFSILQNELKKRLVVYDLKDFYAEIDEYMKKQIQGNIKKLNHLESIKENFKKNYEEQQQKLKEANMKEIAIWIEEIKGKKQDLQASKSAKANNSAKMGLS